MFVFLKNDTYTHEIQFLEDSIPSPILDGHNFINGWCLEVDKLIIMPIFSYTKLFFRFNLYFSKSFTFFHLEKEMIYFSKSFTFFHLEKSLVWPGLAFTYFSDHKPLENWKNKNISLFSFSFSNHNPGHPQCNYCTVSWGSIITQCTTVHFRFLETFF